MTGTELPFHQIDSASAGLRISSPAAGVTPLLQPVDSDGQYFWRNFRLGLQLSGQGSVVLSPAQTDVACSEKECAALTNGSSSVSDPSQDLAFSDLMKHFGAPSRLAVSSRLRPSVIEISSYREKLRGQMTFLQGASVSLKRTGPSAEYSENARTIREDGAVHPKARKSANGNPDQHHTENILARISTLPLTARDVPCLTREHSGEHLPDPQKFNSNTADQNPDESSVEALKPKQIDGLQSAAASTDFSILHERGGESGRMSSAAFGIHVEGRSTKPDEIHAPDSNVFQDRDAAKVMRNGLNPAKANDLGANSELAIAGEALQRNSSPEHAKAASAEMRAARSLSLMRRPCNHTDTPALQNCQAGYLPGNPPLENRTPAHAETASTLKREECGVRRPFDVIDGEMGNGTMQWKDSGARGAEAGFQDPHVGWISVRARLDGGAVHASVIPASTEAAQSLASQMGGLNIHMANRLPDLPPVTLSAPDSGWGNQSFGSGANREQTEDQRGERHAHPRGANEALGLSSSGRGVGKVLNLSSMSAPPKIGLSQGVHFSVTV